MPASDEKTTLTGAVGQGAGAALGAGAMQIGGNIGGDAVSGAKTTTNDQRGQNIQNQTNIAGDLHKPRGS